MAPAAQGRGLGTFLLQEYLRLAQASGHSRLALEVAPSATRALALYRENGFAESERRQVADPETGRTLRYVHLTRALP